MLLNEALVQLQARIPMYRTGWTDQDGYVVIMPGMLHVWKIVLHPAPNAGNYIFSVEDLEADDWAVYTGKVVSEDETEIHENKEAA